MESFTTERFLRHIRDVDGDLRLTALFDLRQYVNSTVDPVVPTIVVERTLGCLTREERKSEVWQEAVSTIPVMAVACHPGEQRVVLKTLLAAVLAPTPQPDELAVFLDLQDLSALALKATVSALVNAAHHDVGYWQSTMKTIQQFTSDCSQALTSALKAAGRDTLYATLNTIVPVFGTALECGCVTVIFTQSLMDARANASLRRSAVSCCASLTPFVEDCALRRMQATLAEVFRSPKGEELELHVRLLDAMLRSDPERVQSCIAPVIDSLVAHLGKAAETYETALGVSDAILRLFDLAFTTFSDAMPAGAAERILTICGGLAVLDPSYCGAGESAQIYGGDDDDQDDYYDDGLENEVDDSTWKLRMGALRVLMAIAKATESAEIGAHALAIGTAALQDRVLESQLEAFNLITVVASKAYCTATQLRGDMFDALMGWAANGGDASSLAALKAVESIFRTTEGCGEVLGATAVEALVATLQSSAPEDAQYVVEMANTARAVLEGLLRSGGSSAGPGAAAKLSAQLAGSLLAAFATARASATSLVMGAVSRCNQLIADVAISAPEKTGQVVAEKAVDLLIRLAGDASAEDGCRGSAVEALGVWAGTLGLSASASRALSQLTACLLDEAVRLCAMRTLLHLPLGDMDVARIPASVLRHLAGILATGDDPARQLSLETTTRLVAAGVSFSQDELQAWVAAASLAVSACQAPTSSGSADSAYRTLALALNLIATAHQRKGALGNSSTVAERVIAPAWTRLSTTSDDVSSFTDALRSLVKLSRTTVSSGTAAGSLERVAVLLTTSRAAIHKTCIAVGAAFPAPPAVPSVNDAAAVLTALRGLGLPKPVLLVCMGEVGRLAPLPSTSAAELLESVQDDSAEIVRTSAEAGLAASLTNPSNSGLVSEVVRRITCTEPASCRYYFLKAIRSAVGAAQASLDVNSFTSAAECKRLVDALLSQAPTDDLLEATVACVGAVAQLHPTICTDAILTALRTERDELRLVCAVALRSVLAAAISRGEDTSAIRAAVLDDLCAKELKRTVSGSVPIKTALLRLLTDQPAWIQGRPAVMDHLLVELRENPKLIGTVIIGSYNDRTDKGLEMRKVAFKCVSTVVASDIHGGTQILESCGAVSKLADALIHSCSSANKGEVDASINNEAKLLLTNLLRGFPRFLLSDAQMTALCAKLSADFDAYAAGGSDRDTREAVLTCTVSAILRLSRSAFFFHHAAFHQLLRRAQSSPVLPSGAKALSIS